MNEKLAFYKSTMLYCDNKVSFSAILVKQRLWEYNCYISKLKKHLLKELFDALNIIVQTFWLSELRINFKVSKNIESVS